MALSRIKCWLKDTSPLSFFGKSRPNASESEEYLHVPDDEEEEPTREEDARRSEDNEREKLVEKDGDKTTTGLQAAWNISNLIQGTGTLGIPYAVMQGGYLSLAAIILIAVISNYTGKLIIECLYDKPIEGGRRGTRQRRSYAQIGKACWQAHGSTLVSAAQLMQLTCACVLYLMLVADFFNDVFERHSLSLAVWLVLAGVLVLPSVFLNTMNRISWMSMFSVFSLVLVFCSVIGYGLTQRHTWDFGMPLTTFEGFPVSWSIILFSFVCHPYLPAIEESMEQPEQFNSVMNYSFLISAATKIIYGFVAVLTFKQDTQQEISENLPAGALENTANAFLGLNGLLSYALPSFTLFTIIQKANVPFMPPCFSNEEYQLSHRERVVVNVLRMLFVAFTVGVAVLLPQFSLIMALVGSISGVCLTLVFPCLFDVVLHLDNITTRRYVINLLIICVGVLSSGFGFVFSIIAIMRVYLQGEN